VQSLRKDLGAKKSELVSLDENLVDRVWGAEKPPRPKNKVFPLDQKFSGMEYIVCVRSRLQRNRDVIQGQDF
jgi:Xaa-Pro aminopeptidase